MRPMTPTSSTSTRRYSCRTTPHPALDATTTRRRPTAACWPWPVIALMLVNTYAKKEPVLWGFPFFFWYQFLWVFLCSACTYAAYVIVRKARPHRPMTQDGTEFLDATDGEARR